jgi:hypothetical protein
METGMPITMPWRRNAKLGGVSAEAWDVIDLVLALLFASGFYYYYYVAGVADRNRTLSRASALAFLVCFGVAMYFLVRIMR